MKTTSTVCAVLVSVALTVPMSSAHAAAPRSSASGETVQAMAAAKESAKCKARLKSVKKKVKGSTFASCILAAQKRAGTAVVRTAYDDGSWGKGPYRFRKSATDASVTQHDGGGIVALGKNFWLKQPGGNWVKASATSSDPDATMAHMAGALWRSAATDATYRKLIGSTTWKPTGKVKRFKGVKARQYTGKPKHPSGTITHYSIWLDSSYRPARVNSTVEVLGERSKMTQDFTRWGKKVSIKAPKA